MTEKLLKSSKRKKSRKHGFLGRMATSTGRKVVKSRRGKGRKKV